METSHRSRIAAVAALLGLIATCFSGRSEAVDAVYTDPVQTFNQAGTFKLPSGYSWKYLRGCVFDADKLPTNTTHAGNPRPVLWTLARQHCGVVEKKGVQVWHEAFWEEGGKRKVGVFLLTSEEHGRGCTAENHPTFKEMCEVDAPSLKNALRNVKNPNKRAGGCAGLILAENEGGLKMGGQRAVFNTRTIRSELPDVGGRMLHSAFNIGLYNLQVIGAWSTVIKIFEQYWQNSIEAATELNGQWYRDCLHNHLMENCAIYKRDQELAAKGFTVGQGGRPMNLWAVQEYQVALEKAHEALLPVQPRFYVIDGPLVLDALANNIITVRVAVMDLIHADQAYGVKDWNAASRRGFHYMSNMKNSDMPAYPEWVSKKGVKNNLWGSDWRSDCTLGSAPNVKPVNILKK